MTAPAPGGEGAARSILLALEESGGAQGQIYVNAHGTGTPLNDKTETQAIKTALGEKAAQVLVSSTKSMTGHMLGAAGAVEAIVSVLALHEGRNSADHQFVRPRSGLRFGLCAQSSKEGAGTNSAVHFPGIWRA